MRSATLFLLLALLAATQARAVKSVTVQQLSGEVASFGKQSDAKVAEKLFDLQLTERLSANKLASFEASLPGPDSRRALVALADQSEFLNPPPTEIPNQPVPSVAQQREIIAKSIDHVQATLHQMPNLFANRDTIRFEDYPARTAGRKHRYDGSLPAAASGQPVRGNGALSGRPGTCSEASSATGWFKFSGNRHDHVRANSVRFFQLCTEICRRAT